ncbi:endonuclease [Aquimarina sp. RZ0]|uniref:endonuclease n=1 Tax=Aquimarina sp. RZ0 TaxID=2607730 RepID=UPI0011F1F55B|nr:endonuclease [Aquimarina sp. RZ0]KAA1247037.1 T9SS type A sorting domain-containing protein [Aquimarina sp. RZ0]
MKEFCFSFVIVIISNFSYGQLVINELDSSTPGIDDLEIIEIKSDTPNFSTDGYVLVLFNGSSSGNDASYFSLDLDGYTTDMNGLLLIGSSKVSPVPDCILFDNTIQNGADAIAIYLGNEIDFPEFTQATTANLIDALVYDTGQSDDSNLLNLLGETVQINEAQNGNRDTESIQRKDDGTYEVKTPTPDVLNDGGGIQDNGISFTTFQNQYDEGDTIAIVFTTETNVTDDLIFDFSVTNDGFTTADYSGSISVIIPGGMNTATNTIQLIDDTDDEGDEVMKITFGVIPSGFRRLTDNKEIRIVDNDFTMALWGSPLDPTFDIVTNTAPVNYYDSLEGLSDAILVQAIQDIIADPATVRSQTYADVIDILKAADQSPLNSNKVWLLYTEQERSKLDFQTSGGSSTGRWNREHTYPRSRGGFDSIEADDFADGIDIFTATRADSLRHANSDAHGLRAADGPENSSRGNQDYGEYSGPQGTLGSWKGDVARSVFFLAIRYNGIAVVDGDLPNSTMGQLGDLTTLLDWHRNDPPDDFEMNRNNIIYSWQFNRNPFIDQPDLVEYIWGDNIGEIWFNSLSVTNNELTKISIFPNPTKEFLFVEGISNKSTIEIFDIVGNSLLSLHFDQDIRIPVESFAKGVYIAKIVSEGRIIQKRIIIQ